MIDPENHWSGSNAPVNTVSYITLEGYGEEAKAFDMFMLLMQGPN